MTESPRKDAEGRPLSLSHSTEPPKEFGVCNRYLHEHKKDSHITQLNGQLNPRCIDFRPIPSSVGTTKPPIDMIGILRHQVSRNHEFSPQSCSACEYAEKALKVKL